MGALGRVTIDGRRGPILAFLATAAAGLVVWMFQTSTARFVLGEEATFAVSGLPLFAFFGLPAYVLVALVAGYASPGGFWLWGAAVMLHRPLADVALFPSEVARGVLEPSDLFGFAFASASISLTLAMVCTFGSAVGAGVRTLQQRRASSGP